MATIKFCNLRLRDFGDPGGGCSRTSRKPDSSGLLIGRRTWSRPAGDSLECKVLTKLVAAERFVPAIAAIVTVFCVISSPLASAERRDEDARADIVVTVVKAKNMCFKDTLQVTGVISPRDEILVRPDREGFRVSEVLVEAGESVTSGQTLARLTPSDKQQGSAVNVQAPAAGIISARNAAVGAPASATGLPLFRIATGGEMELSAETPIKTLNKLEPNQPAEVEIVGVDALKGKVRSVSTTINPTTQLGEVRVFIGRDRRLRVGAFGRAKIEIARRCGASVPFSAIFYGPSGTIVQTVRDGRVESRPVTVGLLAAGQAEIRRGITEGELVVPRAGAFVRDGDRVRAIEPRSAE